MLGFQGLVLGSIRNNHMLDQLPEDIFQAVSALNRGCVIAFPTETTYGLGCDPCNTQAVERIFTMKGRDSHKPLLLVAGSWEQVERVAHLSRAAKRLAEKYWPGPLTLVLPVRAEAGLANGVAPQGEVAVRFSSSPVVQKLVWTFGSAVVATSANRSGEPDSRSAEDVRAYNLDVDYIIDGGRLEESLPSTVARVKEDGVIEIIRRGAIVI